MTSSPIIFTTRPPRAVTVSWATSSNRLTTAASSSSDSCWLSMVKPTMSAKPTQDREGPRWSCRAAQQHGPPDRGLDMAAPDEFEKAGHGREGAVGQLDEPVGRLDAEPSPDPGAPIIPRTAGATSASAMRAIEEPMTRASCSEVSTSATPRSTMVWRILMASMSRSVKIRSSGGRRRRSRARARNGWPSPRACP